MTTTKKCWSCDATTPYDQAWCQACEDAIPEDILATYALAATEPYAGAIRMAIATTLRQQRRPKSIYTPRPKTKGLSLEDLDL